MLSNLKVHARKVFLASDLVILALSHGIIWNGEYKTNKIKLGKLFRYLKTVAQFSESQILR